MTEIDSVKTAEVYSMHRAVSMNFLKSSRALAVHVVNGGKNPRKGWDPRSNNQDISNVLIDKIEYNGDNFGVHLTGSLVDVDVDTNNPIVFNALDLMLPKCNHIWGRPSKMHSHRVYSLREDFDPAKWPFLKVLKSIDAAKVEMRGGPLSRAEYSVMPGSIHTSGEPYLWSNLAAARNTPSIVDLEQLVIGVRKACAIAVLGEYWGEGVRQELTMALAGFLHRIHTLAEATGVTDSISMDYGSAVDFFKSALECFDDDPNDRRDRLAAFAKTWKKADEGIAVTGATRISEITGDEQIIRRMYFLLSDNPGLQKLEEYLQKFVIWVGPGNVIDVSNKSATNKPIMSRQGFINSYGHEFIEMGGKSKQLAEYMFTSKATQRVNGILFAPGKPDLVSDRNGLWVNQWGGFDIEPWASSVPDQDVKQLTDYMFNIVANKDVEIYKWLLDWTADIFQRPANKPGTAVVLVGLPGAGKSFLGEQVIMPLIGKSHAAMVNDLEKIAAKHNLSTANRLFVLCNEATNSQQKATTARFKSIITDSTQMVEPKNVDSYEVENHSRYMLTSNEEKNAVYIPDLMHDRRFMVQKVSNEMVGKEAEYWIGFSDWAALPETRSKILRWLLDHKYDPSSLRRAPITRAKINMIQSSISPFNTFIERAVNEAFPLDVEFHTEPYMAINENFDITSDIIRDVWPVYVCRDALFRSFAKAMKTAHKVPMSQDVFFKELSDNGLVGVEVYKKTANKFDMRLGKRVRLTASLCKIATYDEFVRYMKLKIGADRAVVINVDNKGENDAGDY